MRRILVVLLACGVAFAAGMVVDRYALSHSRVHRAGADAAANSLGEYPSDLGADGTKGVSLTGKPGGKPVNPSSSVDSIVAAIRNAMNRPNDRRGYLTASKLIDGIEPSKIRAVIAG